METKVIVTPVDKYNVEIKEWITGKEKRILKKSYFEQLNLNISGKKEDIEGKVNPIEIMEKQEDAAINLIVVSINGEKEDILGKILDMKSKDYSFVIEELKKVYGDQDFLPVEPNQ